MCRAIRDGGRRCPIHRHSSLAAIRLATAQHPLLNQQQVEHLFRELRREGNTSTAVVSVADTLTLFEGTSNSVNEEVRTEVMTQAALSRQHDSEANGAVAYATSTLLSRAASRQAALYTFLEAASARTGYTVDEMRAKFDEECASVDMSRGADMPTEMTPAARRRAAAANLPYDRASVVALERINAWNPLVGNEVRRRVALTSVNADYRWGYHNGRVEIEAHDGAGSCTQYVYRDVPPEVWNEVSLRSYDPRTAHVAYLHGRPEYQYATQEDADRDALAHRCVNCGQFRSLTGHDCPATAARAAALNSGISSSEADVQLTARTNQADGLADEVHEETITITDSVAPPVSNLVNVPDALAYPDVPTLDPFDEQLGTLVPTEGEAFDHPKYMDAASVLEKLDSKEKAPKLFALMNYSSRDEAHIVDVEGRLVSSFTDLRTVSGNNTEVLQEFFSGEHAPHRYALMSGPDIVALVDSRQISIAGIRETRLTPHLNTFMPVDRNEGSYDTDLAAFTQQWGDSSSDTVAHIATNRTPVSLYGDQNNGFDSFRLPRKTEMNAAFKKGQVVVFESKAIVDSGRLLTQGTKIEGELHLSYAPVTGKLAARMTPEGEVELVGAALKCTCEEYKQRYNCPHVLHTRRKAAHLMQRFTNVRYDMPGIASERAPANTRIVNVPGQNLYALASSAQIIQMQRRSRRISAGGEEQLSPIEQDLLTGNIPEADLTPAQRRYIYLLDRDRSRPVTSSAVQIRTFHMLSPTQAALLIDNNLQHGGTFKVTDLEGEVHNVQISAIYGAGSTSEHPEILHRTLKCNCRDYAETYDCQHVRDSIPHLGALLTQTSEVEDMIDSERGGGDTLRRLRHATENYQDTLRAEANIADRMRTFNLTHEEATHQYYATKEREEMKKRAYAAGMADYRAGRLAAWEEEAPRFTENMDDFQERLTDLERRRRRGETLLEAQYENVTDGICAPGDSTRSFGVEIEFDGGDLEQIGRDLYDAGLTTTPEQEGYHDNHGNWETWSFEEDGTVDGEIISPILKDTPEHWQQLEKVIEIVKRNGGKATLQTGSHVHISSGSYENSTATHAELVRLMRRDEDLIYRLSTDPSRGTHRGLEYCSPNIQAFSGEVSSENTGRTAIHDSGAYQNLDAYHGAMVSFEGSVDAGDAAGAHIEFRSFDGSLNLAVIQQQVALAAAYTDLAERNTIKQQGRYIPKPDEHPEPIGMAYARMERAVNTGAKDMGLSEFAEHHKPAARAFDELFRTEEQRTRAAALYAMTKPQEEMVDENSDDSWF